MKKLMICICVIFTNSVFAEDIYNNIDLYIINNSGYKFKINVPDSDHLECLINGNRYNCGTSDGGSGSLNQQVIEPYSNSFVQKMIVTGKPEYSMLLDLVSDNNEHIYTTLRYGDNNTNWNKIYDGRTKFNITSSNSNYTTYPYDQYNQMATSDPKVKLFTSSLKNGGSVTSVINIQEAPDNTLNQNISITNNTVYPYTIEVKNEYFFKCGVDKYHIDYDCSEYLNNKIIKPYQTEKFYIKGYSDCTFLYSVNSPTIGTNYLIAARRLDSSTREKIDSKNDFWGNYWKVANLYTSLLYVDYMTYSFASSSTDVEVISTPTTTNYNNKVNIIINKPGVNFNN